MRFDPGFCFGVKTLFKVCLLCCKLSSLHHWLLPLLCEATPPLNLFYDACLSPPSDLSLLLLPLFSLAAKRKAWKLNRVGSLRSIYANSLHNSEGKNKNCSGRPVADRWTPPTTTTTLTPPLLQGGVPPLLENLWWSALDVLVKTGLRLVVSRCQYLSVV